MGRPVLRQLLGRTQHRGLAQEAAWARLDWARRAAVAPYLIALIHPDNAAPWSPAVVYRHDLS